MCALLRLRSLFEPHSRPLRSVAGYEALAARLLLYVLWLRRNT
jgi:hypothetical protein